MINIWPGEAGFDHYVESNRKVIYADDIELDITPDHQDVAQFISGSETLT